MEHEVECIPHKGAAHGSVNSGATGVRGKGWLTPCASFRVIDASKMFVRCGAHKDHDAGSAMAVEMVARTGGGGTEYRGGPLVWIPPWRLGEFQLLAGDRVPDHDVDGAVALGPSVAEEDAAMARVARLQSGEVGMGLQAAGGGHGNEASGPTRVHHEAEHGWCSTMEVEEPTPEAWVGDEVEPPLADEAGADEARRAVGWEPEQDLFDDLVHQRWWRRRHDS